MKDDLKIRIAEGGKASAPVCMLININEESLFSFCCV